ncbi:MAG: hypothetical protein JW395_1996 [Nitrospira sp.]|nr:hypothetical protein [Nitrospira sp.]
MFTLYGRTELLSSRTCSESIAQYAWNQAAGKNLPHHPVPRFPEVNTNCCFLIPKGLYPVYFKPKRTFLFVSNQEPEGAYSGSINGRIVRQHPPTESRYKI